MFADKSSMRCNNQYQDYDTHGQYQDYDTPMGYQDYDTPREQSRRHTQYNRNDERQQQQYDQNQSRNVRQPVYDNIYGDEDDDDRW